MTDISTVWDPVLGMGDWVMRGAVLESDSDLVTSVLISLFTDRLANGDDVLPSSSTDPRGWVGDLGESVLIGSLLWLLDRSKLLPSIASEARDMAADALQWMIDDSVVVKFDINTEVVMPNRLNMQIVAYKRDGSKVAMDFTNAWGSVS